MNNDDWITLYGGGQISRWKFWQSSRCPITNCGKLFNDRESTKIHFRKHHVKKTTYCAACNGPVICSAHSTDMESHYRRVHPDVPFQFDQTKIKQEPRQIEENQSERDGEDCINDNDIITLTGLGKVTQWRFFSGLKFCPYPNCQEDFEHRSEVINHFRLIHSGHAILCSQCCKPIYTYSVEGFIQHYRSLHPNSEIPYDFNETKVNNTNDEMLQNVVNQACPISNDEQMDGEQDDLITLTACGVTTEWRFPPKITHCPKRKCSEKFDSHSIALRHYIAEHASNAIFCSLCQKPITVYRSKSFCEHYRKAHPFNKIPYKFDDINESTSEMQQDNSGQTPENDLIILNGCGRKTFWHFPKDDSTQCPRCSTIFQTRSAVIQHYQQTHAQGSILCQLCDIPIKTNNTLNYYISHYHRVHPYMKIPFNDGDDEKATNSEQLISQNAVEGEKNDNEIDDIIILKGLGQSMKWRLPQNITRCPIYKCGEAFEFRSNLRDHYQQQHAPHMILCEMCNKPFRFPNLRHLLKHYRERHPNSDLPTNLIKNITKSIHARPTDHISGGKDSDDEENDLITLEGCNQITKWKFFNQTHCPIYNCRKEYGIRSGAIEHFKSRHAKCSVFCEICDRPVSAKSVHAFQSHFKNLHPDVEPPEFLKKPILKEDENADVDDVADDDIDGNDLISLTGYGISTQWVFPADQAKCPVKLCQLEFDTRSDCIRHYKRRHTKNAILCELCDKPISVGATDTFVNHFRRVHPFKKIPFNLDDENGCDTEKQDDDDTDKDDDDEVDDLIELSGLGLVKQWRFPRNVTRCPTRLCNAAFKSRSAIVAHYRALHASNSVLCPACIKPVNASNPAHIIRHFQSAHKYMEIPVEFNVTSNDKKATANDKETNEKDDLIELKGGGSITIYRFPQTTSCPARGCTLDSGFRSRAIDHFRRKHANDHVFCVGCDKIIGAKSLDTFVSHYKNIHPNAELPDYLKKPDDESDSDDEDYIITLNGNDQTTQWAFPKRLKKCPTLNCSAKFQSRSQAACHYQKHHSNAVVCTICDKPISANGLQNVVQHYNRIHPNDDIPHDIKEKMDKKKKRNKIDGTNEVDDAYGIDEMDESDSDDENTVIILTGANRTTEWVFPDVTTCPNNKCRAKFATQLQTMRHFQKHHAMKFQYCSLCNKAVSAKDLSSFKAHFKRAHPNKSLPDDFTNKTLQLSDSDDEDDLITLHGGGQITQFKLPKTIERKCPVWNCRMEFGIRSDVLSHFKKRHTLDHFYCKHCDKAIFARNQNDFYKHSRKAHPNVKQQIDFEDSFDDGQVPSTSKVNQTTSTESDSENTSEIIELTGCGILTYWKYPKTFITKCPVHKCDVQFETRLDGYNHYKEYHAKHAVYCTPCNKPVMSHGVSYFKTHYLRVHPNEKFPFNTDAHTAQLQKTKSLRSSGKIEKMNEFDDIITLEGCNQKIQYKFPDVTQCPLELCRRELGDRAAALLHFKNRHAKNALYCSKCDSPIEVYRQDELEEHNRRVHADENVALSCHKSPNVSKKSPSLSSIQNVNTMQQSLSVDESDSDDDLITLCGLGRVTEWRFPLIKYCPVPTCRLLFGVRSDAIVHYRKRHSADTICCVICGKPITTSELELHYQQKHPDADISMNFDRKSDSPVEGPSYTSSNNAIQNTGSNEKVDNDEDLIELEGCGQSTKWQFPKDIKNCPALRCDLSFSTHSACRNHFKKVHAKHSICCPKCNKPYVAFTPSNFISHYRRAHPTLQMPFKFDQKSDSINAADDDAGKNSGDIKDDDIITLSGYGHTTKWRVPPDMNKCPVMKCQQVFKLRSDFLQHYKGQHAENSILCDLCDKPLCVYRAIDWNRHYQKLHPSHKIPFGKKRTRSGKFIHSKSMAKDSPTNSNKSNANTDQIDDLITLTGLKKVFKWRFPPNLKNCPFHTCGAQFKNRSAAINHYKIKHASSSVLCSLCNRPISVTSGISNYTRHFKRVHPHVKMSLKQITKIESNANSHQKLAQASKPGKNAETSCNQNIIDKKERCTVCGKKVRNLSRHMAEIHTTKCILCPLKGCDFTSKRIEHIRNHWKTTHPNLRFPEISRRSDFTYKTSTADTQESDQSSKSEATNNSQSVPKNQPAQRHNMEGEAEHSLLIPLTDFSSSSEESSCEDHSSAVQEQETKRMSTMRNKRKRQSSESSSSSSSTGNRIQRPGPKRYKLVKKRSMQFEQNDNTHKIESVPVRNVSSISMDELLECSVSLERLDFHDLNKSNANNSLDKKHEPSVGSTKQLMPQSTVNTIEIMTTSTNEPTTSDDDDIGQPPVLDIESDHESDNEQKPCYYEMENLNDTSASHTFETNAYDPYNSYENQLSSTMETHSDFESGDVSIINQSHVVYDVLDSDEEEALNSRDSGRDTNDTIADMALDSKHIPMMGVLMMKK